jgi:alpha-beta hydrolase superfamily lysophospholipase
MAKSFSAIVRSFTPCFLWALAILVFANSALAQSPESRFADVNGTRIHYLAADKGEPIVLLHGYAQTSHMWRPLISQLATTNAVIAPDLCGFGQSANPAWSTTMSTASSSTARAIG